MDNLQEFHGVANSLTSLPIKTGDRKN